MAEPKNTQYVIPLEGQLLNTSAYEYDTKQFVGFNKLEGSYFQGCLSPFYSSEEDTVSEVLFVDGNDNSWSAQNGIIKKNGNVIAKFPSIIDYQAIKKVEKTDSSILAVLPDNQYIKYSNNEIIYVRTVGQQDIETVVLSKNLTDIETHICNINNTFFILVGSQLILKVSNYRCSVIMNLANEVQTERKYISIVQSGTGNEIVTTLGKKLYHFNPNAVQPVNDLTNSELNFQDRMYYGTDITEYLGVENNLIYFRLETPTIKATLSEGLYNYPCYWYNISISGSSLIATDYKGLSSEPQGEINASIKIKVNNLFKIEGHLLTSVSERVDIVSNTERDTLGGTIGRYYIINSDKPESFEEYFIDDLGKISGTEAIVYDGIRILGIDDNVSNISFTLGKKSQGTIIENWNTVNTDKPIFIYDENVYYFADNDTAVFTKTDEINKYKQFLNRYIVRNNACDINCFDTVTNKFFILGTDVMNNFCMEYKGGILNNNILSYEEVEENYRTIPALSLLPLTFYKSRQEAESAIYGFEHEFGSSKGKWCAMSVNEYYVLSGLHCSSSILNAVFAKSLTSTSVSAPTEFYGTRTNTGGLITFANLYLSTDDDISSTPLYRASYNYTLYNNSSLTGRTYPNDANGNVFLNISPYTDEIDETFLMFTSFRINKNSFAQLASVDGINLLNYYLLSVSYDTPYVFSIAGQLYSIRGQTIYYSSVNNGVVQTFQPIINIGKMKFLGTLPLAALFFSEVNKKVYSFTGDTNLTEFLDITRYGKPLNVKTNTTSQDIILLYETNSLIINSNGIYELPVSSDKVFFTSNSILFYKDHKIKRISYFKVNDNYKVIPLKVSTCFYGLQNNVVSTNDCIYLRLYNPNDEKGSIRLKAITLMNGIKETTTKVITPEKFDEESKTYYYRFQPELQKATSECLEIETEFGIGSIIFSNMPDTTLNTGNKAQGHIY